MMNCLIARAALLADPSVQDKAVAAHLADCAACRNAAAAALRDDALLRNALNVQIPEQLAERILLQAELKRGRSNIASRLKSWAAGLVRGHPGGLALALSMVIAVGLWVAQPAQQDKLNWGEVALAHAIAEPSALASTATLSPAVLAEALAAHGLALTGDLGVIRVVSQCPVPGGRGTHVVIQTRNFGVVTLILPPVGQHTAPGEAHGEGLSARMVEVGGVGFGVVASDAASLPALATLLVQRIHSA